MFLLYAGIEPMGLIWSMQQVPGQRYGIRLRKVDVTTPQIVAFYVYSGHFEMKELYQQVVIPLASAEVKRWYMSKAVRRIPVKEGDIRGTLFIPSGKPRNVNEGNVLVCVICAAGNICRFGASAPKKRQADRSQNYFRSIKLCFYRKDITIKVKEHNPLAYYYHSSI